MLYIGRYVLHMCKMDVMWMYTSIFMYICIYVYICIYICIYVYMYICLNVHMCVYVNMYICIYIYVCIYLYTYSRYRAVRSHQYLFSNNKRVGKRLRSVFQADVAELGPQTTSPQDDG